MLFGTSRDARAGTLHVECSCGWRGPEHAIAADTLDAAQRADEQCMHDFRLHLGWKPIKLGG